MGGGEGVGVRGLHSPVDTLCTHTAVPGRGGGGRWGKQQGWGRVRGARVGVIRVQNGYRVRGGVKAKTWYALAWVSWFQDVHTFRGRPRDLV